MTSQAIRILGVLGWTAACFAAWLAWTWAGAADIDPSMPEQATGAAISSMCGAGCAGSVWVGGLAVGALVWALVRR